MPVDNTIHFIGFKVQQYGMAPAIDTFYLLSDTGEILTDESGNKLKYE